MTLLTRAVDRLREQYAACGEMPRFEALSAFVGVGARQAPPSYEEVAKTLGVNIGSSAATGRQTNLGLKPRHLNNVW
jgi:hypothetical protein